MDNVSLEEVCDWDFETLRHHAEAGLAVAQHHLGCLCDLQPDGAEEAACWWQKAAAQGYAAAMNDLGANYEEGRGVEKDESVALEWYRRAAEQGNCLGMSYLAIAMNLAVE